ncbi:MAG: hypothetical protein IJV35_08940 [Neisseriaceae bacterium]|nr:hypothetical protein [Neisseriaceae bacterium]
MSNEQLGFMSSLRLDGYIKITLRFCLSGSLKSFLRYAVFHSKKMTTHSLTTMLVMTVVFFRLPETKFNKHSEVKSKIEALSKNNRQATGLTK